MQALDVSCVSVVKVTILLLPWPCAVLPFCHLSECSGLFAQSVVFGAVKETCR